MGLYKRKDSKVWWISFTVNGRQYHRSTGATDKRLAKAIMAKIKTQIAEGKWFDVDDAKRYAFDELMGKYISHYSKINKAESTYSKDKSMLENHLKPYFSGMTLQEISSAEIIKYKNDRLENGASQSSVGNELGLLRNAFKVAICEFNWKVDNAIKGLLNISEPIFF